jgi:hypothetical protein
MPTVTNQNGNHEDKHRDGWPRASSLEIAQSPALIFSAGVVAVVNRRLRLLRVLSAMGIFRQQHSRSVAKGKLPVIDSAL